MVELNRARSDNANVHDSHAPFGVTGEYTSSPEWIWHPGNQNIFRL